MRMRYDFSSYVLATYVLPELPLSAKTKQNFCIGVYILLCVITNRRHVIYCLHIYRACVESIFRQPLKQTIFCISWADTSSC